MATAVVSSRLHIEPNLSQRRMFIAKTQASRKIQSHEPKIKHHYSKSNTINRGQVPRVESSVSSVSRLVSYVNSGCLENARHMFETMNKASTFVWNTMIRGLVDSGLFEEAIVLYCRMQFEGIKPDNFTFPFVIKACTGWFGLEYGQSVHSTIIKLGFDVDIYICNALIVMYAKVGCIEDSEKIFGRMFVRDVVSWNSMISGYVSAGDSSSSLLCLQRMHKFGVKPDKFSFIAALGACTLEGCLLSGKEIFCQVVRNGLELDSMIQSSIIDMFGRCGDVDFAERFCNRISQKNVVVWNSMIGAYALNDKPFKSFACLEKMQEDDVAPDIITLINFLPSCSKVGALLHGKTVHGYAIKMDFLSHLVLETALVDMYGKCGRVKWAERVFFGMKQRNLVSWNSMISAYVQNSNDREAIKTFQDLLNDSYVPNEMTFASVLPAYAEIALPKEGKQVHGYIYKLGVPLGIFLSNAMIHMYAKCGDLEAARKIFDSMLFKDVVSWNTIIMAYAIHGFGTHSSRLFSEMINDGYQPNSSTFVSLLSACSISGFLNEGWQYFNSMKRDYGLDPAIEHYGCMLDLLGRFGSFDQAKRLIEEMPLEPTSRIWGSLLAASRHHRNIELAEVAANHIFSLDNDNTGCYILLSNMYAEFGRWDEVARVRSLMKKQGIDKTTGCSIVECNGENLYFYGVSKFKPPDLIKTKGNSPACHSVRLAICLGLIGTKDDDGGSQLEFINGRCISDRISSKIGKFDRFIHRSFGDSGPSIQFKSTGPNNMVGSDCRENPRSRESLNLRSCTDVTM
ncbi:hypothetical protein BUALT_Bualt15G0005600 [Buddleja alternifolia]|uniref:Pentatricopeptide repeat-containing protein n=1 Tax=Buddleja alternifolia TaxID=168488 RepID=A0AAV6WM54_9LAMI|nr:hypothetical protein BUALT_Bualt15G0005600 [Buddleja alternifolia]